MTGKFKKLRILLVNTLYSPFQIGGAEKSVQSLAEALVSKNHEVGIITLGKKTETTELNGVKVFRFQIKNIYWPFEANPNSFQKLIWHKKDTYNKEYDTEFLTVFKNFQPDVLHTHNLGGISVRIWELAKENKIPVFHTLRDYYLMSTSTTNLVGEKKLDYLFGKKRKKLSQLVDSVSGISEFILNSHLENGYFNNANSEVIYNGFPFPNQLNQTISSDKLRFGFIGQIKEHKGIYLLLRVVEKLNSDKLQLKIAGDAPEELMHRYTNNAQIEFLGYRKSDSFLSEIDILVVPSLWHEPFGRVVMEGLAQHKIVIGSKMGGIPELLKNNPDFIFEPDEESLTQLMTKLITDRNFIDKFKFDPIFLFKFSIESMVTKYESEYKRLILRANEN